VVGLFAAEAMRKLQGGGAMPPMAVQVHVLKAEPLDNSITTTGTLLPNEEVDLVSELAGRVTMIGFQEGGNVSAGQVLVRINDDELQAQLRKAEANLKLGTDDEGRKKQLLAVSGISQEQYDASQAQLAALQADADNLRAQVAKSTIRAPFSGKVGLRSISEGGYVGSNTLDREAPTDRSHESGVRRARALRPHHEARRDDPLHHGRRYEHLHRRSVCRGPQRGRHHAHGESQSAQQQQGRPPLPRCVRESGCALGAVERRA
jgi:multidrug efflux pump subunit AcrA (membrane-fusion protein)